MDTNGHEWNHEIQEWNHEWTRMDTKKKAREESKNHEIQEWNHEKHEIHEKDRNP